MQPERQEPAQSGTRTPSAAYVQATALRPESREGELVELNENDRATRLLVDWLERHLAAGTPPHGWQVPLIDWCQAKTGADRAIQALRGLIEQTGARARLSWTAGNIYLVDVETHPYTSVIEALHLEPRAEKAGDPNLTRLWVIPNDNTGGLTAMFPEEH